MHRNGKEAANSNSSPTPATPERAKLFNRRCVDAQERQQDGVHRPAFTQAGFNDAYVQLSGRKTLLSGLLNQIGKPRCSCRRWKQSARRHLPVLGWLRSYPVKEYLLADVITGFTVAMFHVPQSLGYALLASVPPVCALYNAMFPMMIYALLGTARQASVGADAVTSMMTGSVVRQLTIDGPSGRSFAAMNMSNGTVAGPYTVAEVTTSLCLTIGIIQLAFCFMNLGTLNVFLSEHMISGFATGVGIQVVISQLGSLFGNKVPPVSGMFTVYRTLYGFFERISDVAWPTALVAFVAIAIIMAVKLFLDPPVIKKLGIPLPIELTVVVLFTVASHYFSLNENYGVAVVGTVPEKLPEPSLPSFNASLIIRILPDSFVMAIVSFAITLSLGRIFGQKHGYAVDANQEFLALGASHVFSSFFSCFPLAASVPRSAVQEGAGGKTQCVLAAIIVTSLKSIVMQVRNFKRYWDISKIDGQVWIVSFSTTVVFDIITGLACGVGFSLLTLIYKIQRPKTYLLGPVADTEFFVPVKKYQMISEVPKIKIFHFGGPIHFANAEYFKSQLSEKVGFTVRNVAKARRKAEKVCAHGLKNGIKDSLKISEESETSIKCCSIADGYSLEHSITETLSLPTHIILDFSRVSFMDGTSTALIKQLKTEYDSIDVKLFIAACSSSVFELLRRAEVVDAVGSSSFFPSVFDAVQAAQYQRETKTAMHRCCDSLNSTVHQS
ncbi:prestin-like isoform X2 [Amblyomma americanum]